MFLAIILVPILFQCIYPIFSQETEATGVVNGRLSPLGGAQGEEH